MIDLPDAIAFVAVGTDTFATPGAIGDGVPVTIFALARIEGDEIVSMGTPP